MPELGCESAGTRSRGGGRAGCSRAPDGGSSDGPAPGRAGGGHGAGKERQGGFKGARGAQRRAGQGVGRSAGRSRTGLGVPPNAFSAAAFGLHLGDRPSAEYPESAQRVSWGAAGAEEGSGGWQGREQASKGGHGGANFPAPAGGPRGG